MEVVTATPNSGGVPPFHDHDVREWSRIDSLTGALERARLETDHWSAHTINSSHKYGKVVDSLARTDADGGLQHAARRQLEVFHSQVPGGRLQVVKTHAISKWTNKIGDGGGGFGNKDFENLQLSLNPLDLSSQKSKASILRSVTRRPPTRQRPKEPPPISIDHSDPLRYGHITAATNLHRVSRLCHQIHESAVKQAFGRRSPKPTTLAERHNCEESVKIHETNGHTNLVRTKSSSSDDINQIPEKDLTKKSVEDLEDLEQLQNWRRTSKIRRSLQFPKTNKPTSYSKPIDLPESSVSVRKIREELEKGRRLNTALRNNSVDLDALDQILQSISSTSSDKASDVDVENDSPRKQKRNSFVTVESLQEVKGRLRRTSSPTSDIYKVNGNTEDPDDGIVTEETSSNKSMPLIEKSHIRSYVYGMETMLNKKLGLGTGSLESRVKLVNGGTNRSEDWYNRRKSYGFEQVHNHEDSSGSMSLKNKNLVESSTDSGICQSTEIVVVPTTYGADDEIYSSDHSDLDQKMLGTENGAHNGIQTGQVRKLASTFNQKDKISLSGKISHDTWSKHSAMDEVWPNSSPELKSTTITIPIVKNNNVVDLTWNDEPEKDIKRHSIAVDESKYVTKSNEPKFRRTSLATNDQFMRQDEDENNINRRTKKVEFCKTEVHFAAESGKVNIVATDEKPPPTQNFRRRRRNSGPTLEDLNKNGLPVLHFGDSTDEKSMFGNVDDANSSSIYENVPTSRVPSSFALVTVNTNNNINDITEEEKKELSESEIKGILKNKSIKPKPYHLGETVPFADNTSDEENKWGVTLRHVEKPDIPIWKSTVTVHNYYEKQNSSATEDHQPEFQKLLRNLRPTRKTDYTSDGDNRYFDVKIDNRRSSWSMTDKKTEDSQKNENTKGYSTKINFGEGQATVIQNDRHPTWPRSENLTKDSKQLLNKGLVVRIGREDSALNHTVCSKMTTTQDTNNATTTTKITIDLSPSPPTKNENRFTYAKYQRSHNHSFKSTSLILNTIKDRSQTDDKTAVFDDKNEIPQQLEALKKLYEDINSDSDADKEVQLLMSKITPNGDAGTEDDTSSVLSGSWSKMRAYKNITGYFSRASSVKEATARYDLKLGAKIEKESDKPTPTDTQPNPQHSPNYNVSSKRASLSPVLVKKPIPVSMPDLKSQEKLSSPFLVGRNSNSESVAKGKDSPNKCFKTTIDKKLQTKHSGDSIVLRQPKKSEMTYFGVNISPKPVKKISQAVIRKEEKLSEKSELIKHYKKSPSPTRTINKSKSRQNSPKASASPIYENIKNRYTREFDSSILDELTKAADQILQAVNGYTDEDSHTRHSSDDEENSKKKIPLETIAETKSWKQGSLTTKCIPPHTKVKLKHTSSTSSIESVSRTKDLTEHNSPKAPLDRHRKKPERNENNSARANTKARRLQRASSREALLQSHGSSSEDLPAKIEVPARKPRLVKKTKTTQLTITNGLELKKSPSSTRTRRKEEAVNKEERILGSLPEIRHKTAVSTIRSTTDKSARDRTRQKTEDVRKKPPHKREASKVTNPSSRTEKERVRAPIVNKETVVQHRISTANIKKCYRSSEGATRH